ncbi:Zinc finger C2H2-type [Sesbania bispinosa]|nr:Zinc finger C2H2-type [Sesbania bispinosa]
MEERNYVCRYCYKRFPCGKSLGGHIRTHMSEERSNIDSDMLKLDGGRRKKRDLWSEADAGAGGNSIYGLRENPKKTMRFVHSDATLEQVENFCKECGKGFPSLKALCGHMACHSEKEKRTKLESESEEDSGGDEKEKLVMDSQSDTETCAPTHPRRSKRMRFKSLTLSNHSSSVVLPLGNGSSPVSEVEQEQEEVARCLMLLSKDSSFKGRFASESSDNNSVVLEAKSSSLDTKVAMSYGNNFVSNGFEFAEKKLLLKGTKLKSVVGVGVSENSDSRCFRYGPKTKRVDSDVSHDEFKRPKIGDKSGFEDCSFELNRGRSKCSVTLLKKLVIKDFDCDRTDGKRANYDSLSHKFVGISSKKRTNGSTNDEIYENGRKGWKYEKDNDSYDSTYESDENSSESDSYPAPRYLNSKSLNGKKSSKTKKKKLKSKKSREHECPICYKIFKSGQALGGHKRSHFIGGSEENTLVIKQSAPVVPCLIDLNLPAPVDD